MSTLNETGHAKNVANFEKLVTNISGLGEAYNPSNVSLKLPALNTLLGNAKSAIVACNTAEAAAKNAVKSRELVFEPLSKLTTRVSNALKVSGAPKALVESALSLIRKLQGRRATPKLTEQEKEAAAAEGKPAKEISSSHMSFDSRLDNFDKLIKLLATIAEYAPNEPELTVAGLTQLYNQLNAKNLEAISAEVPLTNARTTRNNVLYTPQSGLTSIATDIKSYVKSVFGTSSPQYKAISGLRFLAA